MCNVTQYKQEMSIFIFAENVIAKTHWHRTSTQSTQIVAMTDFWQFCAFHHDGNISPGR
jgi:hypothetical protein